MSDRKAHIIDTAISLFLEQGVDVSTAKIAKTAGVANGTLFNNFPTKQNLIDETYLKAKTGMNTVFAPHITKVFNRDSFHDIWVDYLAWGRRVPKLRKIMHWLVDSGLASDDVKAQADEMTAPAINWFEQAYDDGKIVGPNTAFIAKVFFTHLDLVIDQNLTGADESLAFSMICNTIGLQND